MIVGALGALFGPKIPSALGCSCVAQRASLLWPVPGSHDVRLDTSIVVAVSSEPGIRFELRELGGELVQMEPVRKIEVAPGCENGVVVFKPHNDLPPGRPYTLTPIFDSDALSTSRAQIFYTGSDRRLTPTSKISLSLFAQQQGGRRVSFVFAESSGENPFIMVSRMSASTSVRVGGRFPAEEPIGVRVQDPGCASIELVDLDGKTIRSEELCEPIACIESGNVSGSACTSDTRPGAFAIFRNKARACGGPSGCTVGGEIGSTPFVIWPLLAIGFFTALRSRDRSRTL